MYFNIEISIATSGKTKIQPCTDYPKAACRPSTNKSRQPAFSVHVAKTTLWCLPQVSFCPELRSATALPISPCPWQSGHHSSSTDPGLQDRRRCDLAPRRGIAPSDGSRRPTDPLIEPIGKPFLGSANPAFHISCATLRTMVSLRG
jgi:hypothetical protein